MTREQKQALQEHIQAIARILYEDTSKDKLTNLALIEEAVRSQMQKHIMPEVGVFLQICSIGSGSVESAVKQVDRRTKISGAQWKRENVPQVLPHRCAYLNGLLSV